MQRTMGPGHHYLGKGKIHYIKVMPNDNEEQIHAVTNKEIT